MNVAALAGGVGGAKLADGLAQSMDARTPDGGGQHRGRFSPLQPADLS